MKTKEELLEGVTGNVNHHNVNIPKEWIYQLMDEYAKQQAIEFDKWIRLKYTWDKWLITKTEDAYELFLNRNK